MKAIQSIITLLLLAVTCSATSLSRKSSLIPRAGTLEQVTDFGDNPTNVDFYIYVPKNVTENPAIIVALHYCTGTAQAYYVNSPYATQAEKYGFIVIYPESPYEGKCWDVSSQSSLTHNGGGNSNSIANMVTWTIKKYSANASRVYVTGTSSGAMMTNVMAATYPELFAAGTVYSGVAAGCFYSDTNQENGWNSTCSQGQVITTPQNWANIARAMYPGYNGSQPRMQIYHGTADEGLLPQNFYETCKQWAGIFGYNYAAPQKVQVDTPEAGYNTTIWGPNVQGILAEGVGHTVPIHGDEDLKWFGFTN